MTSLKQSDHLFGLLAWLTTRNEEIRMGAKHDCTPALDLLKIYMDANDIGDPSPEYPDSFTMPKGAADE